MKEDWPHAPVHRLDTAGTYCITGATYLKTHFFRERVDLMQRVVFRLAADCRLPLHSWAFFSNHYHLILEFPDSLDPKRWLRHVHRELAVEVNHADETPGRRVMYQYWDTKLTFEKSWLARINYVNENPVHHGLVADAEKYPWCAAGWFRRMAKPAFVQAVRRFKIDRISVPDDF